MIVRMVPRGDDGDCEDADGGGDDDNDLVIVMMMMMTDDGPQHDSGSECTPGESRARIRRSEGTTSCTLEPHLETS